VTASIIEWKFSEIDNTKIIYIVEVTKREGATWQLKKRYKEFDDLNKSIKKLVPNLPVLPGKTLFAVKDPAELEKRKQGLDAYLKVNKNTNRCLLMMMLVFGGENWVFVVCLMFI